MKKLLVVLLSLGLIAAFSTAASAVDVKFSGEYYVEGNYDNNDLLRDKDAYSRASFWQRLRMKTVFEVAPGLSLTTQFDAAEKQWGQTDLAGTSTDDKMNTRKRLPRGTAAPNEQENFEFEQGWMTFKTAVGLFDIGYQGADMWGTNFGDSASTRPRIRYAMPIGPVTFLAIYEKAFESDSIVGVTGYRGKVDADSDNYYLAGVYKVKAVEAGFLYKYVYSAYSTIANPAFKSKVHGLAPYMKGTFGPVYVEAEMTYIFGKQAEFQTAGLQDIDRRGWNAYALARVNVGPAYFGGQVGWVQGDGDDRTEVTTGADGGYSWAPTLVFNNINLNTWKPFVTGGNTYNPYKNDPKGFFLYQAFVGFNPTPKINMELSGSVLSYDKKKQWNAARTAQTEIDDKIGTEIDVQATYKIFDNLSYMVGAAYIIAGDAWKGTNNNSGFGVGNDYLLMNKLTLRF